MRGPASFLNEKTVEYILVPQLVSVLQAKYESVIPFHFWANREGGSRTSHMMIDGKFKLIVLYARRPKVYDINDDNISVKINTVLFERSKYFKSYDVSLIAGVPLISNFSKIRLTSKCAWFQIGDQGYDEVFLIDTKSGKKIDLAQIKQLSSQGIINLTGEKSQKYKWDEIIAIIKNIPNSENYRWHFMGERYKPVYILMRDD
jgi:hypothetical protein